MKMILMAVTALLLIGGGVGAYFFLASPAEASAEEEEVVVKDDHGDDGYEGGKYEFVELDPLILPIVDHNGLSQVVSMVVVLEVKGYGAAEDVRAMAPRLKDAYIQDMYGVLNQYAALKGGVIEVSKIKHRLNKISTKIMGEDKVNDVLLQAVQQRPI